MLGVKGACGLAVAQVCGSMNQPVRYQYKNYYEKPSSDFADIPGSAIYYEGLFKVAGGWLYCFCKVDSDKKLCKIAIESGKLSVLWDRDNVSDFDVDDGFVTVACTDHKYYQQEVQEEQEGQEKVEWVQISEVDSGIKVMCVAAGGGETYQLCNPRGYGKTHRYIREDNHWVMLDQYDAAELIALRTRLYIRWWNNIGVWDTQKGGDPVQITDADDSIVGFAAGGPDELSVFSRTNDGYIYKYLGAPREWLEFAKFGTIVSMAACEFYLYVLVSKPESKQELNVYQLYSE